MEVAISFRRSGSLMFEGVCQIPAEANLPDLRADLSRMMGYANQGGRQLTMVIQETPPVKEDAIDGFSASELAVSLAKLLRHDGVVNAESLTPRELIEAVQDHIVIADVEAQKAKQKANKAKAKAPAKKAATPKKAANTPAKTPVKKPAKKKSTSDKSDDKQAELGL